MTPDPTKRDLKKEALEYALKANTEDCNLVETAEAVYEYLNEDND